MKDSSGAVLPPGKPPPSGWRLWCMAVRPRTLLIAVAPVVAGAGLTWGQRHGLAPLPLVAALIGALFIQMGTNLWNDVADGVRGGDPPQRLGPLRVTALGWAEPGHVRRAALLCFALAALAALAGLYLTILGGWPILAPAGAWPALAAAPWALRLAWSFRHAQGRQHNSFLAATARLQLLLGVLVALGCAVAGGG